MPGCGSEHPLEDLRGVDFRGSLSVLTGMSIDLPMVDGFSRFPVQVYGMSAYLRGRQAV